MERVNHNRIILVVIVLGVVGVIFYLTFQVIKPFIGIISTAGIFAIFLNPVYNRLKSLTAKSRLSAFLSVISLLSFIIIPLGLLISSLFNEAVDATKFISTNPEWINSSQSAIEDRLSSLPAPFQLEDFNLEEQIYQLLSFLASNLGTVAAWSFGIILNLFFALLTIYFLLINQNKIATYVQELNLFPKRYYKLITSRIVEIVNGTVRGYLLVIALQFVVGFAGFTLFQIPTALLLGSLYGLSSMLPVVGGFLLWVPVVIWQMVSGNISAAIMLTLWFLLLSFLIENIIAPKIIGQHTKLHQLFIMFSVFGGIQYFGLLGMILGPVVIALAFVALTILKEFATDKQFKQDETA